MHANEELLEKFQNETMNPDEMIAFLSHLEECDFCLNELMDVQESKNPVPAPSYLKEQILERAMAPDIQVSKTVRTVSRKTELFFYGLKTAAGVILALLFLFSVNFTEIPDFTSIPPRGAIQQEMPEHTKEQPPRQEKESLYDFSQGLSSGISKSMNGFTQSLNGFTNKILNGGK